MNPDINISLGAIHSPEDYRDNIAAASAVPSVALPDSFQKTLASPMMQAKTPSCVAHSVTDLLKLYWFLKTGKWIDFSPRFLDILAKRTDGQPIDGGTIPRLVMRLAATVGCVTTDILPNDTSLPIEEYRDDKLITQTMLDAAAQYKTGGYKKVPLDLAGIRTDIYLYGAVSALFIIGDEFWTPSWADKDIDPLRTPQTVVGGHQLTVCGWDHDLNIIQNEWSTAWANGGRAKYDPSAWSHFISEAWTFAEIPDDVKTMLSSLPKQSDFHYTWDHDMHQGDNSEQVKFLQVALMILGYLGPIDPPQLGIYGPKTAVAVGRYQASKMIYPIVPGSVGPRTRAALNKQFIP